MPSGTMKRRRSSPSCAAIVRVVQVIVVIVRDDDRVDRRQLGERDAAACTSAAGRPSRSGEARSLHTGSVSTRWPSISTSIVECPSQVTRRPVGGRRREARRSIADVGTGCRAGSRPGWRGTSPSSRPSRRSTAAAGSRSGRPLHCGERSMRARRAPVARWPKALQPSTIMNASPSATIMPSAPRSTQPAPPGPGLHRRGGHVRRPNGGSGARR